MFKIAIIAGEPSGDMLASQLMLELKRQINQPIEFMGIGGEHMYASGLDSLHDMDVLSIGGFGLDVICALPKIIAMRHTIIQQIITAKVDVFIGVDAPDFNFYIEKKLKQHGIRTVHYISPTIWAWRYKRIYKIKKSTDLMLCIFPMEEAIYRNEAIPAKFVGNPLADEIMLEKQQVHYPHKEDFNNRVFTILVGSRKSEINNLGKIFIQACNLINQQLPNSLFLFPVTNQRSYYLLFDLFNNMAVQFNYQILINQTRHAIQSSDLVLAKSGTVTLEVALCKVPLIISYKIPKLSAFLIKRMVSIKHVGQPNILLKQEVAPELLQEQANAENIAQHFLDLYNNPVQQQYMQQQFTLLHQQLRHNASMQAAQAIMKLCNL